MRLRRLDLTRFGQFTHRSLDLGPTLPGSPDFHIIYGANEAGKTTLMEAYLRLIYGFPLRDDYSFKHPLTTLQVGGLVEIDGVGTELVRVKKPANSLLDRHGDVIPETILQSCLGGIAQDDYRKLFCLDDTTIEAGGEEITNSKGDIGRLLFSAAAGIGNLTGVLDQVAARAEAFYKKGASKTAFAGLKRDLDAAASDIKALDISASLYHALHTAVAAAKAIESVARAAKFELEQRKSLLAAVIAAHPIAADLRSAEEKLLPIRHYPLALDIDPETLVDLMNRRVALEAVRDQQAGLFAQAQARREALVLRPEILTLRDRILALDELRGRMEGALADLPNRKAERAAALADMRAKLVELGLDPGDDPIRFVLPEHRLRGLERALQAWRDADTALAGAVREDREARIAHEASAAQMLAAEAAVTIGPEVSEVLIRFGATQCVEENRVAVQRLTLARATATQSLRDLKRGDAVFGALPPVALTLRQADGLAADSLKSDQAIASLGAARDTAAGKSARAFARLAVLRDAPDLATDDLARSRRAERSARWTTHRAALDAATADAFADAMQHDDRATALRQAQTREIAEYQQARIAANEAEADLHAAKALLKAATEARHALDATLAAHLAAISMPLHLTAADLVDWLRQQDAARLAQDNLQTALETTSTARAAAEALHAAFKALPGLQGDDLNILFRSAQEQATTRQAQLAEVQRIRDIHAKDATALSARQVTLDEARSASDDAAGLWQAGACIALPPDTPLANLRDALPGLRGLREINEKVEGFSRQIDGMIRDQDDFSFQTAPLARAIDAPPDHPALEIYRLARIALANAETAAADWDALTRSIEVAQSGQAAAIADLATQDTQILHLAKAFAADIATASLQELRGAVLIGNSAIALRAATATHTTALFTRLGVTTRAAADELLAEQPLAAAEATLATLTNDSPRLAKAVDVAIETRATAQAALDRVQGDADVARRVTQARTIEVAMQDGTLRYLEDRFAHLLAERAIRRYRDAHRSGMLVATEAAFRTLTNGAYAALTTQTEGHAEALVAIQSPGGSAKQAREMSKGTRFQLYLALRAAAYAQLAAGGTILPFFCDDIFETFDDSRTTAACGLMRQIGQRGQAIYLTHHKHVADIARKLCGDDVRVHELAE